MNGAMKLIRNARLYAPEDLGCMDVLIGGGKILRIGESLPAEEAYHVEVIDGSGKIMMPGLIDAMYIFWAAAVKADTGQEHRKLCCRILSAEVLRQ